MTTKNEWLKSDRWTTQEDTALLTSGDIVALNGNLIDHDKEVLRFLIVDCAIGWVKTVILFRRGGDNWNLQNVGDTWTIRRAKLIGKNWRIV
jgi:hypothetical protein